MSVNTLLLSDEILKERSIVHGNMDPKLLYPDIKTAQDLYIVPILGTALFNKLQTLIETYPAPGSMPASDYKTLLEVYVIDTLINYTLSELPVSISFQFWNKGVIRKQGESTETPSMSDLVDISNRYKQRAESYSQRLRQYLKQNAPTKFTEYLQPGNGIDTIFPDNNGFTIPIYLGDDDNYCNDGGFTRKPYTP